MAAPATPPATPEKLTRDQQQRRWEAFRAVPGNSSCCECSCDDTTWAVLDYGILICINCAGAHRALGSHISKVRSTELDDFSESLFLWFESLGNKKNNDRWEAELPANMRRPLQRGGPECVRRWWLRAKYDEMRFLAGTEDRGASHESMRGWLSKQGQMLTGVWRQRYFVVEGGQLRYYQDEDCKEAKLKNVWPLSGASVSVDEDDCLKFTLALPSRELSARASSQAELEAWVWCLFHATYAAGVNPPAEPLPAAARRRTITSGWFSSRASVVKVPASANPERRRRSLPG